MSQSGDNLVVWAEQSYNNTVVRLKTSGFWATLPLVGVHFLGPQYNKTRRRGFYIWIKRKSAALLQLEEKIMV